MFTQKEHTEKRYTVQDAINAAKYRFPNKPICINVLRERRISPSCRISLVELNDIADGIVEDSAFYDYSNR